MAKDPTVSRTVVRHSGAPLSSSDSSSSEDESDSDAETGKQAVVRPQTTANATLPAVRNVRQKRDDPPAAVTEARCISKNSKASAPAPFSALVESQSKILELKTQEAKFRQDERVARLEMDQARNTREAEQWEFTKKANADKDKMEYARTILADKDADPELKSMAKDYVRKIFMAV